MPMITDVHTHSKFSPDGYSTLEEMIVSACEKGVRYYGVAEHFDYIKSGERGYFWTNEKEYFPTARVLQKKYADKINLLVGAEIGFSKNENACKDAQKFIEDYKPDFIVNSIHGMSGLFDGDP